MATAADRRFELLRKRAQQQSAATEQKEQEGLKRTFSRTGGLGSGAFVKAQQSGSDTAARRLQQAEEGISMQEMAEAERREQIGEERAYRTGERVAGQEYASGERVAGQEFVSGEAGKQRKYLTGERVAGQEFTSGEADKMRGWEDIWRGKTYDLQYDTFEHQKASDETKIAIAQGMFDLEEAAQAYNIELSKLTAIAEGIMEDPNIAEKIKKATPEPKYAGWTSNKKPTGWWGWPSNSEEQTGF